MSCFAQARVCPLVWLLRSKVRPLQDGTELDVVRVCGRVEPVVRFAAGALLCGTGAWLAGLALGR